jgi:hypothetical protein
VIIGTSFVRKELTLSKAASAVRELLLACDNHKLVFLAGEIENERVRKGLLRRTS